MQESNNSNILIVDDEAPIRRLLNRMLSGKGYGCALAEDAAQARALIMQQKFELILCDVNMPGESGLDLIRSVLAERPDTAVLMVTAMDDAELAETAIQIGAYGYIIKPFKLGELLINVANALRRRKLEIQNRLHQKRLEKAVADRTAELQKALENLKKGAEGMVQAMSLAIESRDPYTAGHQRRVSDLACAIAREMQFSENTIQGIHMAGMIHDLGKIAVPAEILSKPGKISEMEFGIIKCHPRVGYDILKDVEFPWPIALIVQQHHERMDGSGYPDAISGNEILIEARVICVADVVEAMASHRPYRPSLGIDTALEEITKQKGVFYDPTVVDACLAVFKKRQFRFASN